MAMSEHLEGIAQGLQGLGTPQSQQVLQRLQELNGTQARGQGMVDIQGALTQAGVVGTSSERRRFDDLYTGLSAMTSATVIDAQGNTVAAIRFGENV
jgi:hypothetical protein